MDATPVNQGQDPSQSARQRRDAVDSQVPMMSAERIDHHTPEEASGFGALQTSRGVLPLREMSVSARVVGLATQVRVEQTFINACDEPLEATYVFPLPARAAVTRFRFKVAGRVVEGQLKERGQARRDYDQAIARGQRAAIAEEERPDVFTMRVGNLMPGEAAGVELTMTAPLACVDGEATWRFPLVVAERYTPGVALAGAPVGDGVARDTDAAPDASRVSPPVLLPGFPSPVQLTLTVEIDRAPLAPRELQASLHGVRVEQRPRTLRVTLDPGERLDRDFILRFLVGEEGVSHGLTLAPDGEGEEGTFALTLLPPVGVSDERRARDVVFVLDRSGSMGGWKMVAARRAIGRMIDTLHDEDRFTVLAFDDRIEAPPCAPDRRLIAATDRDRYRVIEFVSRIDARGGTEMAQPLNAALSELADSDAGRQRVLVLVTDGQVTNEKQILRSFKKALRRTRVFTVGIDRAVNASFLERLAELGGGGCELVETEDRLDEAMDRIHRHIGTPVLTELRVDLEGASLVPDTLTPRRLPALFEGTPLVVRGRYRGDARQARVRIQAADARGGRWETRASGEVVDDDGEAVRSIWARAQVRALEDALATGAHDPTLRQRLIDTSLRFGVLCQFTAFVAVDREEVVNPGGDPRRVMQPVESTASAKRAAAASSVSASGAARDPFAGPDATPEPEELGDGWHGFDEADDLPEPAPMQPMDAYGGVSSSPSSLAPWGPLTSMTPPGAPPAPDLKMARAAPVMHAQGAPRAYRRGARLPLLLALLLLGLGALLWFLLG